MQFNRLNKKDLHQDSFPLNAGHSSIQNHCFRTSQPQIIVIIWNRHISNEISGKISANLWQIKRVWDKGLRR